MRIVYLGARSETVFPITTGGAAEAGSWGVVPGGSTKGAAIASNDGLASYIDSGPGPVHLDQGVRMSPRSDITPRPASGWTITVEAWVSLGFSMATPCQLMLTNNGPRGVGTDLTGIVDLIPVDAPATPKRYIYTLPTAVIAALSIGPAGNWWVNFRAGLSNSAAYRIGYVRADFGR